MAKMEEFRLKLSTELQKELTNIFQESHSQTRYNENYLKATRPMEWDKVVELHEKFTSGKYITFKCQPWMLLLFGMQKRFRVKF